MDPLDARLSDEVPPLRLDAAQRSGLKLYILRQRDLAARHACLALFVCALIAGALVVEQAWPTGATASSSYGWPHTVFRVAVLGVIFVSAGNVFYLRRLARELRASIALLPFSTRQLQAIDRLAHTWSTLGSPSSLVARLRKKP